MSVSCTRELEMATEVFSGVYDIVYPSPVSLKNLAAMAVSLEVWRCEIIKHRTSDTLEEFWPSCECISLKTMFPGLPSMITNVIQEYITRFALSLKRWLTIHFLKVLRNHNSKTYILKKFDDFVCDYDGHVHHEKTDKRMMDSDALSQVEKFEIACTHFYEDDIRRLWPSVCEKIDLKCINFRTNPQLYYWVCCLRNELEKIPFTRGNISGGRTHIQGYAVNETMLQQCMTNDSSRQSVQYFWDRIPLERRMRTAVDCLLWYFDRESFVRFILPKLDEEQLAEFANKKGVELMNSLLLDSRHDETLVLSTWMYIRNIMNVGEITRFAVKIMQTEGRRLADYDIEKWFYLCIDVLNYLPLDFKLTIIRAVLSNNNNVLVQSINAGSGSSRAVEFLSQILLCVHVKERNSFWHDYWHLLIPRTRCEDLKRIMDICFENEEKIAEFKENITIENESVRDACVLLWNRRLFKELNRFVSFCYPDTEKARRFKQWLLRSVLVGDSVCLGIEYLSIPEEFNEFVDDTYEDMLS